MAALINTYPSGHPLARPSLTPRPNGMYDRANDSDACGLGFVANIKGARSHSIVEDGLKVLDNLEHRGATGADPKMGDGAGMLVQIPHELFRETVDFSLPERGEYAVGVFFMPPDDEKRAGIETIIDQSVRSEGLVVLGWRDVPVDASSLSRDPAIIASEPVHRQLFVGRGPDTGEGDAFERALYLARRVVSNAVIDAIGNDPHFYAVSMSSRTIVYKGMFLSFQLGGYYTDLRDERFTSAVALVHQRFSTNTFPS